jgi:hypothetical protein
MFEISVMLVFNDKELQIFLSLVGESIIQNGGSSLWAEIHAFKAISPPMPLGSPMVKIVGRPGFVII